MLQLQIRMLTLLGATRAALARRVDLADERGEVTSTTILVAVFAALALAAGAIVVTKTMGEANSIPTGGAGVGGGG